MEWLFPPDERGRGAGEKEVVVRLEMLKLPFASYLWRSHIWTTGSWKKISDKKNSSWNKHHYLSQFVCHWLEQSICNDLSQLNKDLKQQCDKKQNKASLVAITSDAPNLFWCFHCMLQLHNEPSRTTSTTHFDTSSQQQQQQPPVNSLLLSWLIC